MEEDLELDRFLSKTVLQALSGGIYFSKELHWTILFFHRYLWFFFFCLPFSLSQIVSEEGVVYLYIFLPVGLCAMFLFMKLGVKFFHKFFDRNERGVAKEFVKPIKKEVVTTEEVVISERKNSPENTEEKEENGKEEEVVVEEKKKTKKVKQKVSRTYYFDDPETGSVQQYEMEEEVEVEVTDNSSSEDEEEEGEKAGEEEEEGEAEKEEKKKKKKKKKKKALKKEDMFQFKIMGKLVVLWFDRSYLDNLLDRNNFGQLVFSLFLTATTAFFLVYFLYNVTFFIEKVFVTATACTAFITLLKSPQPDGNSFLHYAPINGFSRAFFFTIMAIVYLVLNTMNLSSFGHIPLYLIILQPLLFLLGCLPNCKTLFIYAVEFIHINFFGGTGITGLIETFCFFALDAVLLFVFVVLMYYPVEGAHLQYQHFIFLFLVVVLSFLFSKVTSYYFQITLYHQVKISKKWSLPIYLPSFCIDMLNFNSIKKKLVLLVKIGANVVIGISLGLLALLFRSFYVEIYIIVPISIVLGIINHVLLVEVKMFNPFNLFTRPFKVVEASVVRKVVMYTRITLRWIEVVLNILLISQNFFRKPFTSNRVVEAFFLSIFVFKLLVVMHTKPFKMYKILFFATFYYYFDYPEINFVYLCFIFSCVMDKITEFNLKLRYVFNYRNIKSISAIYHIVLYPIALPHTSLFLALLLLATVVSCPLIPWLGSNLWLMSYPRSVKFWEKKYKTRRKDISSMSFSQSLISGGGSENYSDNLNSVFYEHLVVGIQHCKNLFEYFGNLDTGDIFIIMNDDLTALVHFIEVGNNFVTFQLRGLEFKGTVCQEKEQEALVEAVNLESSNACDCDEDTFCGKIGGFCEMLRHNLLYSWKVISNEYYVSTYRKTENKVDVVVNSYDSKKSVIDFYIFSIAFFMTREEGRLALWISDDPENSFFEVQNGVNDETVFLDVFFNENHDSDYDVNREGCSFVLFKRIFGPFIDFCVQKMNFNDGEKERIRKWYFLLAVVARRSLYSIPEFMHTLSNNNLFIENLYRNFTLDFNIANDLWVFRDTSLLKILSRSLIMGLRVFMDSFIEPTEGTNELYEKISSYHKDITMVAEKDEEWEHEIMEKEAPQLFTLRKIIENNKAEAPKYVFLQLKKEEIKFNIIKLNKYSVRSLWAAQQNELIFLGNQNRERGSIQQFEYVLRNIITTSADVPIGYPVYISPLTTSFQGTY